MEPPQQWLSVMWEEWILPIWGHFAKSGDIFGCHHEGWVCYWNLVDRGQDAAKRPAEYRTAPHGKESSSSECRCPGWERSKRTSRPFLTSSGHFFLISSSCPCICWAPTIMASSLFLICFFFKRLVLSPLFRSHLPQITAWSMSSSLSGFCFQ